MGAPYQTDAELFDLLRQELFTAVVGDVLDKLGYLHQFLPPGLAPLRPDMVLAGRAMPVLEADVFDTNDGGAGPLAGKPFGLMLEALDSLRAGDIYVATGGAGHYALWGELMTTRALALGARGVLLNGFVRDSGGIEALDFPTFCRGCYAQDQGTRGQVIDYRVAVEIGGIRIEPGTLLFGDREGVIVVPKEAEEETVRLALEKVRDENRVAEAIRSGMSATEAFERFGVM